MKIIAAFAFLALAHAATVKIAPPFKAEESLNVPSPVFIDSRDLKDIPAANPTDFDVPIRRFDVPEVPVVVNSEENAPQYQSPVDIGLLLVPEEVMRAVAAADAENAEPIPLSPALVPESEDFSAVRVVDSPLDDEQVLAPSEFGVRIAEVPEEIPQVLPVEMAVPMPFDGSEGSAVRVVDSPMEDEQILRVAPSEDVIVEAPQIGPVMPVEIAVPVPFVESEDISAVKMDSQMEPEEILRVAPSELEAVRVVEVPEEIPQVMPVEMAVPVPFAESEDFSAVKVVDSPLETEEILRVAPTELEAVGIAEAPESIPQDLPVENQEPVMPFVGSEDNIAVRVVDAPIETEQIVEGALSEVESEQPKEYVNVAEMLSLLQDGNRPYPAYNNPMMR